MYEIRKVAIYLAFELLAIYFNFNILFEVNVKVYTWAAAMGKVNFLNHLWQEELDVCGDVCIVTIVIERDTFQFQRKH